MSLFYDPQTKNVRPWVYIVFILVPIILIIITLFGTRDLVNEYKQDQEIEETQDILKDF